MWLYDKQNDTKEQYFTSVHSKDNVLDGLDFETLITEIKCNYPKDKINKDVVYKQLMADLEVRIEDARFLLELCLENIIKASKGELND